MTVLWSGRRCGIGRGAKGNKAIRLKFATKLGKGLKKNYSEFESNPVLGFFTVFNMRRSSSSRKFNKKITSPENLEQYALSLTATESMKNTFNFFQTFRYCRAILSLLWCKR